MNYEITHIKHAAHTGPNSGWDSEQIIVKSEDRTSASAFGLPEGFEYHSGFRDSGGDQNWMFYRRVPFSLERCANCPKATA